MESWLQNIGIVSGIILGVYGAYNSWRANRRIDEQESLCIIPSIDDDTGNSLIIVSLSIENPLSEIICITDIQVSPPMHPQEVMHNQILPQATPHPQKKFAWDESIQPHSKNSIILYYDEEKQKLDKYSVTVHYRTSKGKKRQTTQSFSRGYSIFK